MSKWLILAIGEALIVLTVVLIIWKDPLKVRRGR